VVLTSRAWGDLWHLDGDKRERRNEILRARDTLDYGFVDWLYERTALTPDEEPEMFTPVPLDSAALSVNVPASPGPAE
jgi:salicylate hydroxylase